jgi:hypothetical protein
MTRLTGKPLAEFHWMNMIMYVPSIGKQLKKRKKEKQVILNEQYCYSRAVVIQTGLMRARVNKCVGRYWTVHLDESWWHLGGFDWQEDLRGSSYKMPFNMYWNFKTEILISIFIIYTQIFKLMETSSHQILIENVHISECYKMKFKQYLMLIFVESDKLVQNI